MLFSSMYLEIVDHLMFDTKLLMMFFFMNFEVVFVFFTFFFTKIAIVFQFVIFIFSHNLKNLVNVQCMGNQNSHAFFLYDFEISISNFFFTKLAVEI